MICCGMGDELLVDNGDLAIMDELGGTNAVVAGVAERRRRERNCFIIVALLISI